MHSKLVEREVLGKALENLVASAEAWTFHVARSKLNWDTGKEQQEGIALRKEDDVKLGSELDPRLTKSRRVFLYITWNDGGSAIVNLTERSHQEITSSSSLTKSIKEFERDIQRGTSRFTSNGFVSFLFLWPILFALGMAIAGSVIDPNQRKKLFESAPTENRTPTPPWADDAMLTVVLVWLITVLAAALVIALRIYCGGLRIKRMPITKTSAPLALYKIRSEIRRGDIWRPIATGVVIAAFGAIIGYWLK